jgi:hypothetical protein
LTGPIFGTLTTEANNIKLLLVKRFFIGNAPYFTKKEKTSSNKLKTRAPI